MSELVQIRLKEEGATEAPKQKLYIRTYGCQMNEYDTAKIRKILEAGYESVDTPESADLVIVNTCSVRDKPEQKLYSLLGEMRELKQQKPDLMIGVGGCVAQQEGAAIVKRNKAVDFVFGTHNLSLVPALINRRKGGAEAQVAVDYRDEWEELPLGLSGEGRVSVFVSISRGCNKNCTYCIVPTTRGKEVSRDPKEIEREVRIAVHRGAKEIVLLGQTVNSFGLDLEPRVSFVALMERLSRIDGVERLRFVSPHPQEVRKDFIDLVVQNPKVCRHLHMPLQSGSDRILKLMNRNYRRSRYLSIVEELKSRIPDISLTTDVIVGFPGETEEDFQQTMEIIEQVRFDSCYSFAFSPRPGTEAALMEDLLSGEQKLERLKILQARQDQISTELLNAWVGKRAQVLLDDASTKDRGKLQGRISQNILLNLDREYEGLKPGMLVDVEVSGVARYTLRGKLSAEQDVLSSASAAHAL